MYLRDDVLDEDDIIHGFFDKRRKEEAFLNGVPLLTLKQIHGDRCLVVDAPFYDERKADAMVTDKQELAIGVYTADCAPVLFSGVKTDASKVIGAAHAGWRGAFSGVLENTIKFMVSLGADKSSIKAVIGPTIAQESYEVSGRFFDNFMLQSDANSMFFKASKNDNHFMFDLPGYVTHRLMDCGVAAIGNVNMDTYSNEMDYNSYRRATHRDSEKGLRQISLIYIAENN